MPGLRPGPFFLFGRDKEFKRIVNEKKRKETTMESNKVRKESLKAGIEVLAQTIDVWRNKYRGLEVNSDGTCTLDDEHAVRFDNCPCCVKYYDHATRTCCSDCPIWQMNGEAKCGKAHKGTPMNDYTRAAEVSKSSVDMTTALRRFADAMEVKLDVMKVELAVEEAACQLPGIGDVWRHKNGTGKLFIRIAGEDGKRVIGSVSRDLDDMFFSISLATSDVRYAPRSLAERGELEILGPLTKFLNIPEDK